MSTNSWQQITAPLGQDDAPWELFHENSKASLHDPFLPDSLSVDYLRRMPESLAFDGYSEVQLPVELNPLSTTLHEAITERTLGCALEQGSLTFEALATMLRYSYGVVRESNQAEASRQPRAVYSTGSHYPLELFLHVSRVEGLEAGLYHYSPLKSSLQLLLKGDHSYKLGACFTDRRIAGAAVHIFIAAMPERIVFRYGDRGYRFAMLEAGAVMQNLNLVVSALGLACRNVGEYYDREIDALFAFDGLTISTLYVIALGKREAAPSDVEAHHPFGDAR